MYPFRIRIVDPELERIMNRLRKDKTVTLQKDKTGLKKLSYAMKPIRRDIFIGFDDKTYYSNISLVNPKIKIEKIGKDFVFKI